MGFFTVFSGWLLAALSLCMLAGFFSNGRQLQNKQMKNLRRCAVAPIMLVLAGEVRAQDQTPLIPAGKRLEIAEHIYVIPEQRVNLVPNIGVIVGRHGVLVIHTGIGPKNAQTVL